MKHLFAAVLLASIAVPAQATEWVICTAGEEASFSALVGSMGIGTATAFRVEALGKSWSTTAGEGTPIVKSQAFEDSTLFMADVSTENLDGVVAELRVFKASDGDSYVSAGTLRLPGLGAWAVTCTGP